MSGLGVRVDVVLGGGPFREVGLPRVTAKSPDGSQVAVGGDLVWPQWHGRDVASWPRPHPGWYPFAVYRLDNLARVMSFTTRWPANAIAFHPTLPLLAVGTGGCDGGWFHEGELFLVDLETGTSVSTLARPREVRQVRWRDPQTLDLLLAVTSDEDEERLGVPALVCSIFREDWRTVASGVLRGPFAEVPVSDDPPAGPDLPAATTEIERICRERGVSWERRRAVWAVESLADGRILAGLEDVRLECWSPTGEPRWRVPSDGTCCQVKVCRDEGTALALTQTPRRFQDGRWIMDPSVVVQVGLATGTVEGVFEPGFSAVMVTRADGWWALRDTEHLASAATGIADLRPPRGGDSVRVQVGRYDLFNHFFDIRYAPDLLFLQGRDEDKPYRDKWVVSLDVATGVVRRLFPLEWDAGRDGHLFGGCGAYVDDRAGPSLVHTGAVHDGAGLLSGNSFVVRRAYLTGEPHWVLTADSQATALDIDEDGLVYVAFNSGELVVLGIDNGAVLARHILQVDGHAVTPISLACRGRHRVAVGTLDGRILLCAVDS